MFTDYKFCIIKNYLYGGERMQKISILLLLFCLTFSKVTLANNLNKQLIENLTASKTQNNLMDHSLLYAGKDISR